MTPCPICNSGYADYLPGPRRQWNYLRCQACGHHWLEPMPDEKSLHAYYNDRYQVPERRYRASVARKAGQVRRILAKRHPSRGRLLEIGASYGTMLSALRTDGWDVEGVEIDARAAELARNRHGLRVRTGTLEALHPEGTFDAVIILHVVEHISSPLPFFNQLRNVMKDGATLLLKTPNAVAMVARLTKGWWEWFAAPEHVHIYSPDSLHSILEASGFTTELIRTRRGDAHVTLFELIRAGTKRRLSSTAAGSIGIGESSRHSPVSRRSWYRILEGAISALGLPLDAVMGSWNARSLAGPELFVVAQARRRDA